MGVDVAGHGDVDPWTVRTAATGARARRPRRSVLAAGRDRRGPRRREPGRVFLPFDQLTVASIEELAAGAPAARRWFQLYPLRDRGLMQVLVARAAASGSDTLVVTLELPVQGRRERDLRNFFTVPYRPGPVATLDALLHPRFLLDMLRSPVRFGNFNAPATAKAGTVAQHVATLFDPSADWDLVARLRADWRGRFAVKGILHPDDARRAVEIGADAVIVSNDGGRQLDGAIAAVRALPAIAEAVAGRAEILLDGGVRRSPDILKALALGASACMIGRAYVWGLASAGEAGVHRRLISSPLNSTTP